MMEYKGYAGVFRLNEEAGIFHGEVVNTRDVITFQGTSAAELRQAFRDSVDDYLDFCGERGEKPEKPYSGRFVTRVSPELHRSVSIAAAASEQSLNAWVGEQLQRAVATEQGVVPVSQATTARARPGRSEGVGSRAATSARGHAGVRARPARQKPKKRRDAHEPS